MGRPRAQHSILSLGQQNSGFRRAHQETLPRFLLVAALCVALNGVVVQLGILELGVHYLWAQVLATAIVLVTGFVLNKLWTFGRG